MSNKTQLLNHNERLASVIQTLQGKSVPGGGGGSVETCTVEIVADAPVAPGENIRYITSDGEVDVETPTSTQWTMGFTLTVRINTPIVFDYWVITKDTGNLIKMGGRCYYITGDTALTIIG